MAKSKNLDIKIEDNGDVTIKFNLKKDIGESKSGKSLNVTSTRGNRSLADLVENCPSEFSGIKLGINCYKAVD